MPAVLYPMVPLLKSAEESSLGGKHAAIGAFNVNFYAQAEGILDGLYQANAPGIQQASRGANKFQGGPGMIKQMVIDAMERIQSEKGRYMPVSLHLDHGTPEAVVECIMSGFPSVMIDTSYFPFELNAGASRFASDVAHKNGVSVEAEYGGLGGVEEDVAQKEMYSNPLLVPRFFELSGVDALAITYGTSHGSTKWKNGVDPSKVLNIGIVDKSYKSLVAAGMNMDHFLVGHGSSTVPKDIADEINRYGGSVRETVGVPVEKIIEARDAGIRKFNIDTDLRMAITAEVRKYFMENPGVQETSEPLSLMHAALFGGVPVKEGGKMLPHGELIDPRSYLGGIMKLDPEILRNDYRDRPWDIKGTWQELMTKVRYRVADHVEMLCTDVFNCAGLAGKVERKTLDDMARLYSE